MAEQIAISPPPCEDPAYDPTLPPIIDLGYALAAAEMEQRRLRGPTKKHRLPDTSLLKVISSKADALRALIATLPANTVADAAVQVGVACHLAGTLGRGDWSDAAERERLSELHDAFLRITVSVLPVLATAAGLDLAEMCWDDVDVLRAGWFYGEERND